MGHITSCLFVCLQTLHFILGKLGCHTDIKSGRQIEVAWYMMPLDELVHFLKDKSFVRDDLKSLFGAVDFCVGIEASKGV